MAEDRWDRLTADLTAAGFDAKLERIPFNDGHQRGIRSEITFRLPGGTVTVSDAWWRKNPGIWTGWQVTAEDTGSIVRGRPQLSKKRRETVAAVRAAFRCLGQEA